MNDINELDEKVVAMRFDNGQFEEGVAESIGTIERLKKALTFKDSAKGLEQIGERADKVSFKSMRDGLEAVRVQFKMTDVLAFNVMNRMVNKAIDTGKKITKSLTIEPIGDGFKEYELEMGSIKTIMASTGSSLATVSGYLNELNHYADMTIYSFSDMTQNIGKFTNAGVKLKDAVAAIQGISNEAAVSGANANEASRAMYNFAQALSAGYVKLIDWKSIENANMATKEFKQQLIDTAVELGTLTKKGEDYISTTKDANGHISKAFNSTKMFNDSLSSQWMTTDVLTKTLSKYADKTTEIGKKAFEAATKVRTWTQLMDTLKEAAGSGWAKTWRLIIGDFNESAKLFTALSDNVGGFIDKMSTSRNDFLEKVLSKKKWTDMKELLSDTGVSVGVFRRELTNTAKSYGVDVDKMIKKSGSFTKSLKEGWATPEIFAKTLANIKNGDSEITVMSNKLKKTMVSLEKTAKAVNNGEFGKKRADIMKNLTKAGYDYNVVMGAAQQLEKKGKITLKGLVDETGHHIILAKSQKKALQELYESATKGEGKLADLISDVQSNRKSGRTLILESLANILTRVRMDVIAVKKAWDLTFGKINTDGISRAIVRFNEWSKTFVGTTEEANKRLTNIIRICRGVFAAVDLVRRGTLLLAKTALILLQKALSLVNIDLLDLAANLGDLLVFIHDFIVSGKALEAVLQGAGVGFQFLKAAIQSLPGIGPMFTRAAKQVNKFKTAAISTLKAYIDRVKTASSLHEVWQISIGFMADSMSKLTAAVKKIPGIGPVFTALGNGIKSFGSKAKTYILTTAEVFKILSKQVGPLKAVQYIVQYAATNVANGFKKVIASASNLPAIGHVIKSVGELVVAMADRIQNGLSKLVANFTNLQVDGGAILAAIGDDSMLFGDKIKAVTKAVFVFVAEKVKKLPAVGTAFKTVGKTITKFSNNLVRLLKGDKKVIDFFRDSINMLNNVTLEGLKRTLLEAGQWVKNGVGKIYKGLFGGPKKLTEANKNMEIQAASLGVPPTVLESLHKFLEQVKRFTGELDLGNIAALAFAGALIKMSFSLVKLTTATINMLSPLKALGKAINNIGIAVTTSIKTLTKQTAALIKAKKLEILSDALWNVAKSLTLLAGATIALSQVPIDQLKNGTIVMGVICAEIVALTLALSKLGTNLADVGKVTGLILGMSTSIIILAKAMRKIEAISVDGVIKSIVSIGAFMLAYTKMIVYISKQGKFLKVGFKQLIGLAASLFILGSVMQKLSNIPWSGIIRGTAAMNACILALGALIALSAKIAITAKAGFVSAGVMIGSAVALLTMGIALSKLSKIGWATIGVGLLKAIPVIAAMGVLLLATRAAGRHAAGAGIAVLTISLGMTAIIAVIRMMANIKPSTLQKASSNLTYVMSLVTVMLLMTRLAGAHALSGAAGVIVLAGAIAVLAGVALVIGGLDPGRVLKGVLAIDGLMAGLALVLAASKWASTCQATIISIAASISILAASIIVMSMMDPSAVLNASKAISLTMGMFAAVLAASKWANGSKAVVLEMAAVVGVIGGMLYLIAQLPVNNAMAASAAMSLVMASVGLMFVTIAKFQQNIIDALKSIGVMTIALTALTGVVYVLSTIKNTDQAIHGAQAMLVVVADVLALAAGAGLIGKVFKGGAVMSGMVSILEVLGIMTAVFVALGGIDKLLKGNFENIVDRGINILVKITEGIGRAVAGLVTGAMKQIGEGLSDFWTHSQKFFNGMNSLSPNILVGVKALAETIKIMCGGSILGYLKQLLTAKSSMKNFGEAMAPLGKAIVEFDAQTRGINPDSTKAAAEAVKNVAWAAKNLPSNGGLQNLDNVREPMVNFGKAVKQYSDQAAKVDVEAVTNSKKAAMTIIDIAKAIPNSGGLVGLIAGENDLGEFAPQMTKFGNAIVSYSNAVSKKGGINLEAMQTSVQGAEYLIDVANKVPNTGGLIGKIVGNNDLDTFGKMMARFGDSMVTFSRAITKGDGINSEAIRSAAVVAGDFTEVARNIPNTGGWGRGKDLEDFADDIEWMGIGLSAFSKKVSGIEFGTVSAAMNLIGQFVNYQDSIFNAGGGFDDFADSLSSLGTGFADFGRRIKELDADKIKAISTYITQLSTAGSTISVDSVTKLKGLGEAIKTLGKGTFGKFADTVSNTSTQVVNNVVKMMQRIHDNIFKRQRDITAAFKSALSGIKTVSDKVKSEGFKIGKNFGSGLRNADAKVKSQGAAMASHAISGMESKKAAAFKAGVHVSAGFSKGISTGQAINNAKKHIKAFGTSIVDNFKAFFGIHSPATLMVPVGENVSGGTSKGVSSKNALARAKDAGYAYCQSLYSSLSTGLHNVRVNGAKQAATAAAGISAAFANNLDLAIKNGGKKGKKKSKGKNKDLKDASKTAAAKAKKIMSEYFGGFTSGKDSTKLTDAFKDEQKKQQSKASTPAIDAGGESSGRRSSGKRSGGGGSKSTKKKFVAKSLYLYGEAIKDYEKWVYKEIKLRIKKSDITKAINEKDAISHKQLGKEVSRITGGIVKNVEVSNTQLKAIAQNMKVGKGAMAAYMDIFGKKNQDGLYKNISKSAKEASDAVYTYAQQLYKASDVYKQDKQTIKDDKKAVNKAYKDREKIIKNYNKAQKKILKDLEKAKKKKDQTEYDNLRKQYAQNEKEFRKNLKSSTKDLEKAKKKVIKDAQDVEKHVKEAFENVRKKVRETWDEWLNLSKLSLDLGFSDRISKFEDAYATSVKSADDAITSAKDNLKSLKKEAEQLNKELYEAEHMKYENKEKREKIAEIQEKIAENTEKQAEAEKAINEALEARTKLDTFTDEVENFKMRIELQKAFNSMRDNLAMYYRNGEISIGMFNDIIAKGPGEGTKAGEQFMLGVKEGIINSKELIEKEYNQIMYNNLTATNTKLMQTKRLEDNIKALYGKDGKLARAFGGWEFVPSNVLSEISRTFQDETPETMMQLAETLTNASDDMIRQWAENMSEHSSASKSISDIIMGAIVGNETKNSTKKYDGFANDLTDLATKVITDVNKKVATPVFEATAKSLKKNSEKPAKALVEGMSKTINSKTSKTKLDAAGKSAGKSVHDGIKTYVSESKGRNLTRVAVQGMVVGINEKKASLRNSATNAGNEAYSCVRSACDSALDYVRQTVNRIIAEVERALAELAKLNSGGGGGGGMVAAVHEVYSSGSSDKPLPVGGAGLVGADVAAAVAAAIAKEKKSSSNSRNLQAKQSRGNSDSKNVTLNYQPVFTSPRALSREEIYRTSKNEATRAVERIKKL